MIVDFNSSKPVMAPVGANITTVANATVVMKCPNKGTPKPTVSWSYNQRFILPGGRFVMNGSSLVVRGVRLADAGSYQCRASNIYGRDVESLALTVAGTSSFLDLMLLSESHVTQTTISWNIFMQIRVISIFQCHQDLP